MNLVEPIQRGLNWLSTPHYVRARLDMQTRPVQQLPLEAEIVYCTISQGGVELKFPVTVMLLPKGVSPVRGG